MFYPISKKIILSEFCGSWRIQNIFLKWFLITYFKTLRSKNYFRVYKTNSISFSKILQEIGKYIYFSVPLTASEYIKGFLQ